MDDELGSYIRQSLGESKGSLRREVQIGPGVVADFVLEAGNTIYVFEVKTGVPKSSAVAQLALYKDLLQKSSKGKLVVPILVVRNATSNVRELVERIQGQVLEVPPGLLPSSPLEKGIVPLTTEKSWKVVTALLRLRAVKSARALAEAAGVSLGWTHQAAKELQARNIIEYGEAGIKLIAPQKILDAAGLERPFEKLRYDIIESDYQNAHEAAVTLTEVFGNAREQLGPVHFAFGGYTAAALHTGYARRLDRLDLYVDDPNVKPYIHSAGGGIPIHLYHPDRPLDPGAETLEGARVVSRDIALLDVAGLGYAARDLALKLLELYGSRNRD